MNKSETKRIVKYLKGQESEMQKFLEKLVCQESPTNDPDSQQPILDELQSQLGNLNFHVIRTTGKISGGYIIAYPESRNKKSAKQVLVAHCDTVWPINTINSMPWVEDSGKLKGPGIYDMKAGITQIIFALKAIRSIGLHPSLTPILLINSDEEKGSRDSTTAIARLAKIARRAYILEPPLGLEGKLKTARKGIGRFTLTVMGESAHAGLDPGKGASAILELSHQVQQLFKFNNPKKGVTVNVGMIEGGTNANVIAPIAKAVIDVRVLTNADGKRITKKILALESVNPNTKLNIEGGIGRPPMEHNERNQDLWLRAQTVGRQIGLELEEATAGGGSDGNTTSQFTATLDGLGTTGDGAHAKHEFIFSEKLYERTLLLIHLLLME